MPSNPHDRFARRAFSDLDVMRAHLRGFLPPAITAQLDLEQLQREPDVHFDPRLRERLSDLLFTVPTASGKRALVYMLFEHKSTPDRWLAFDLARSATRILEEWRKQNSRARELPWLVPVVLYAGRRPFRAPRRLTELCTERPAFDRAAAPLALDIGYVLTDLSTLGDAELRARVGNAAFAVLAHLALKHAAAADLLDHLARWVDLIRDLLRSPTGLTALESLLSYWLDVSGEGAEQRIAERLVPILDAPELETVMTKMKTFSEARREEGREQGEAQGRQREAVDILLLLLRRRFGGIPAAAAAKIGAASLDELHDWLGRVVDAERLEDVVR